MVVPEALSYGLPVVCFDNHGPGEFINKDCGIAIPYGTYEDSIHQFAMALHNLYVDKERRRILSQNAFQQFEEKFTWEGKGAQIQEVYSAIYGKEKSNLTTNLSTLLYEKRDKKPKINDSYFRVKNHKSEIIHHQS